MSDPISDCIAGLSDPDGMKRQEARRELIKTGTPAVSALLDALPGASSQVRWELSKALAEIADPAAAPALVDALDDEDKGVRWVAAEGLINMGQSGAVALLAELCRNPLDSRDFFEAAHHVIHDLLEGDLEEVLRPVLEAMNGPAPEERIPVVAERARRALS